MTSLAFVLLRLWVGLRVVWCHRFHRSAFAEGRHLVRCGDCNLLGRVDPGSRRTFWTIDSGSGR